MKKSSHSLMNTNPYLKNPKEREARLIRSVISSSAIEVVHIAAFRAMGIKRKGKMAKVVVRTPSKSSSPHR